MAWNEKERYLATSDGAEATIWLVYCPSEQTLGDLSCSACYAPLCAAWGQ